MPVGVGHPIKDPVKPEVKTQTLYKAERKGNRSSVMGRPGSTKRGNMRSWNLLVRTVARKIAQVEASGRDFCRHLGGLFLDLCDQAVRRKRDGR